MRQVFNPLNGLFDRVPNLLDEVTKQIITIGANGCAYSTIGAANAAITDNATDKRYVFLIQPGTYTEDVTLKPWIEYQGTQSDPTGVNIVGQVDTAGTGLFSLKSLQITLNATADADIGLDVSSAGSVLVTDGVRIIVNASTDINPRAMLLDAAFWGFFSFTVSYTNTYAGTTKDIDVIDINGSTIYQGLALVATMSVEGASGTHCVIQNSATGTVRLVSSAIEYTNTGAAFSGTAIAMCSTGVPAQEHVLTGNQVYMRGGGAGTAIGFRLDTAAGGGAIRHGHDNVNIDGFTANQEYVAFTGDGDQQIIDYVIMSKDLPPTGTGATAVYSYDEEKSGITEWVDAGNYYSLVGTTFTVLRGGYGRVRGVPVVFDDSQAVTITANAQNFIYSDNNGTVQNTNAPTLETSVNGMPLFQVFYDGTTAIVSKETHEYSFPTRASNYLHSVVGTVVGPSGADVTRVATGTGGAAGDRQIKIVGENTLYDHGLSTTIPDSAGAAVSWYQMYINGSGNWVSAANQTELLMQYNNGGVLTAMTANRYVNGRLYVVKDDLNASIPKYLTVIGTAQYSNLSTALAARGSTPAASGNLLGIEPCQLGVFTVHNSGGGYIADLQIEKAVVNALFAGSGSQLASVIATDVTNFNVILSATDATSQQCFETIDDTAAKKAASSTDNALVRFDGATGQLLQNSVGILTDGGALSGITAITCPAYGYAGAMTFGSVNATTVVIGNVANTTQTDIYGAVVNIGQAGGTVNLLGAVNNLNATDVYVPNDLEVDGVVYADGGVDRATAASLVIGATNASAVDISKSGVMTTIKGTLNVDEAVTLDSSLGVSGTTTFEKSANPVYIYSSTDTFGITKGNWTTSATAPFREYIQFGRGTRASPTQVQSGDEIYEQQFYAMDATSTYQLQMNVVVKTTATITGTNQSKLAIRNASDTELFSVTNTAATFGVPVTVSESLIVGDYTSTNEMLHLKGGAGNRMLTLDNNTKQWSHIISTAAAGYTIKNQTDNISVFTFGDTGACTVGPSGISTSDWHALNGSLKLRGHTSFDTGASEYTHIGGTESGVQIRQNSAVVTLYGGLYGTFVANNYSTANRPGALLSVIRATSSVTTGPAMQLYTGSSTSHGAGASASLVSVFQVTHGGACTIGPSSGLTTSHTIQASPGVTTTAVLNIDSKATYPSLIGAYTGGTLRGFWGANGTNSFMIFNTSGTQTLAVSNAGVCTLGLSTGIGATYHSIYGAIRSESSDATQSHVLYRPTGGTDARDVLGLARSDTEDGGEVYLAFFEGASGIGSLGSLGGGIRRNAGDTAYELYNSSDASLKRITGVYSGGLAIVNAIPVSIYDWIREDKANDCVGWVAQHVQQYLPKAVGKDQDGLLNLGTSEFLPVMWNAIQELSAENNELKARIDLLGA